MFKQRHVAALLAEYIGTLTLVLVVLSVSLYRFPFFTAIAAGVTIAAFYSAFAKISGGHFNPAVTLALFAVNKISVRSAVKVVLYWGAQFLAGFTALKIYEQLTERTLSNSTTPGIEWPVAIAEFIGAFIFATAIAAIVAQKTQGYQAAYTIGAGLFLGATVATLASPGLINPAVALGTQNFEWVETFAAPILGMLLAFAIVMYVIIPVYKKNKADQALVAAAAKPVLATATVAAPAKKATPAAKKSAAKAATAKSATKTTTKKSAPTTKKKSTTKK